MFSSFTTGVLAFLLSSLHQVPIDVTARWATSPVDNRLPSHKQPLMSHAKGEGPGVPPVRHVIQPPASYFEKDLPALTQSTWTSAKVSQCWFAMLAT